MSDAEPQRPMSSLRLDVTLPCAARYLPLLTKLTVRTVDYLGFHESLRDEVVQAIHAAVRGVFEADDGTSYRDVEVQLATTDTDMLVHIRYLGAPSGAGLTPIEQLLSQPEGPNGEDAPMARLQRTMKAVVVGREAGDDSVDYCELTKALPADP